ncbi:hypothetical protein GCM10028868_18590 [Virgibacillus kimchii]
MEAFAATPFQYGYNSLLCFSIITVNSVNVYCLLTTLTVKSACSEVLSISKSYPL